MHFWHTLFLQAHPDAAHAAISRRQWLVQASRWPMGVVAGLGLLNALPAQPAGNARTIALTLARPYQEGLNVTAYWISEKYDGVRALWDGETLRTRQGLAITAPSWFTAGWGRAPMDGELWMGRGQFLAVQSLVGQTDVQDARWKAMRYMVFDLPAHPGPFDARWPALQAHVQALQQTHVQAAPQWRMGSHAELMRQLQAFTAQGAEGLMLRRGDAPYRGGRQHDLLKLTLWEDDEAVVVAHLPGKGKYTQHTGALLVEDAQGRRFRLGTGLSDADRRNPPALGSTVTYRFRGRHPSGLPRFARFWRVRTLH